MQVEGHSDDKRRRVEHAKAANAGPFVVIEGASHLGIWYRQELVDFMTDFAKGLR